MESYETHYEADKKIKLNLAFINFMYGICHYIIGNL